MDFFFALIFTILIELTVLSAFIKNIEFKRFVFYISIANFLTLPFVWFIFPLFIQDYYPSLFTSEIFAFLFEGIFYSYFFKLNIKQSILLSFLANFTSFSIGFLLF